MRTSVLTLIAALCFAAPTLQVPEALASSKMPLCLRLLRPGTNTHFTSIDEALTAFQKLSKRSLFVIHVDQDRQDLGDLMRLLLGRVVVVQTMTDIEGGYQTVRGQLGSVGKNLTLGLDGHSVQIPLELGVGGIFKMAAFDSPYNNEMLRPFDRPADDVFRANRDFLSLSAKALTILDLDDRGSGSSTDVAIRMLALVKPGQRVAALHIPDMTGGAVMTVGEVEENLSDQIVIETDEGPVAIAKGTGVGTVFALAILEP